MKTNIRQTQLFFIWLLLAMLGFIGLAGVKAGFHGLTFSLALLLIAGFKIQLIADWFMSLREVRMMWRMIMLGWVLVVTGLIAIAFILTPPV